jgi:hypothetical protein
MFPVYSEFYHDRLDLSRGKQEKLLKVIEIDHQHRQVIYAKRIKIERFPPAKKRLTDGRVFCVSLHHQFL